MSKPAAPLTTYEVSRYLHVDLTTVINWCDQGKLQAYRTPGGHRRVQPESFLSFLKEYNLPVPPEFARNLERPVRILVAADDETLRSALSRALRKRLPQAEVREARNAFEAGRLASELLPRLLVLDLKLPGMDGWRAWEELRRDERFGDTRILALAAAGPSESRKRALQAEGNDCLTRPFEAKDLIRKACALLGLPEGEAEDLKEE